MMSSSKSRLMFGTCCAAVPILSCQPSADSGFPPGATGNVETGEPSQVVPLYVTTRLGVWDECQCDPVITIVGGSGTNTCTTPGAQQSTGTIDIQMTATKGTDATVITACTQSLSFEMDEDTTGLAPRDNGTLVCELSHQGTFSTAFNYGLTIRVDFIGDATGTIDTREFQFCKQETTGLFPELGTVFKCDKPYQAGKERIEFTHLFEAGRIYGINVSVDGSLGSVTTEPTWGGDVTFNLTVENLQIEFGAIVNP